jgi:hypothetical protein
VAAPLPAAATGTPAAVTAAFKTLTDYYQDDYSSMPISIAQQATNDLGYIKPKPKAVKAPSPATAPDSNVDVAAALRTLTENNATLARAIIHLSHVIGVTPENGLAVIAGAGIKKSSDSLSNL